MRPLRFGRWSLNDIEFETFGFPLVNQCFDGIDPCFRKLDLLQPYTCVLSTMRWVCIRIGPRDRKRTPYLGDHLGVRRQNSDPKVVLSPGTILLALPLEAYEDSHLSVRPGKSARLNSIDARTDDYRLAVRLGDDRVC